MPAERHDRSAVEHRARVGGRAAASIEADTLWERFAALRGEQNSPCAMTLDA